jgi:hypothetical protein
MALQDPVKGLANLSREGIRFTEAQKEQIKTLTESGNLSKAQSVILDDLDARFGDVAQTVGEDDSKAFDKLGNSWDDFMKGLGRGVERTLVPATKALKDFLDQQTKTMTEQNMNAVVDNSSDMIDKAIAMMQKDGDKLTEKTKAYIQALAQYMTGQGVNIDTVVENRREELTVQERNFAMRTGRNGQENIIGARKLYAPEENSLRDLQSLFDTYKKITNEKSKAAQINIQKSEDDARAKKELDAWEKDVAALNRKYQKLTELQIVEKDIADIEAKMREKDNSAKTEDNLKADLKQAEAERKVLLLKGTALGLVNDEIERTTKRKELESGLLKISQDQTEEIGKRIEAEKILAGMQKQDTQEKKTKPQATANLGSYSDVDHAIGSLNKGISDNDPSQLATGLSDTMVSGWTRAMNYQQQYYDQQAQLAQAAIDREKQNLAQEDLWEKAKVAQAQAAGQSTLQLQADYAAKKAQQEQQIANQEKQLKEKAWQAQHDAALTGAIMSGAQAVIGALTLPPPLGEIEAGIVGALAAVQVGIIQAQQMPQFAEGGIVPGNSFYGDKILARLNSGELVLNQEQQRKLLGSGTTGTGDVHMHISNPQFHGAPGGEYIKVLTDAIKQQIQKGRISASYSEW